jgi:hypothetical protein
MLQAVQALQGTHGALRRFQSRQQCSAREVPMRCLQVTAAAITMAGSLAVAGWLAPAGAAALPFWLPLGCGAGDALCVQACDYSVPGGWPLGKCYDHCHSGTAVCYARQIPRPVHYRVRRDP